jgi:hypothetical protein
MDNRKCIAGETLDKSSEMTDAKENFSLFPLQRIDFANIK